MKKVDRNEENPGNTALGNTVRPHPSSSSVRKEDCDNDPTSDTAWGRPVQFTSSQGRITGQSSSSSFWTLPVREADETSAHSTGRPG